MIPALHNSTLRAKPVAHDALVQQRGFDTALIRPLREGLSLAERYYPMSATIVRPLLSRRRPPTVGRFVAAIIVDPINRVKPGRARAHIGGEGKKVLRPFFANSNSARPISPEVVAGRVAASPHHVDPSLVERMSGVAMFRRIFAAIGPCQITAVTPARERVPASEIPGRGNNLRTTVAATIPSNAVAIDFYWMSRGNDQSAKSLADKVESVRRLCHAGMMTAEDSAVKGFNNGYQ